MDDDTERAHLTSSTQQFVDTARQQAGMQYEGYHVAPAMYRRDVLPEPPVLMPFARQVNLNFGTSSFGGFTHGPAPPPQRRPRSPEVKPEHAPYAPLHRLPAFYQQIEAPSRGYQRRPRYRGAGGTGYGGGGYHRPRADCYRPTYDYLPYNDDEAADRAHARSHVLPWDGGDVQIDALRATTRNGMLYIKGANFDAVFHRGGEFNSTRVKNGVKTELHISIERWAPRRWSSGRTYI